MGFRIVNYCLLGFVVVSSFAVSGMAEAQYGFIVHPSNVRANLNFNQLKRILTGDQQYWPNGKRVVIALPASPSKQRTLLLKEIYSMSEQDFQTFWLARVFRGEVTSSPITLASSDAIAELVEKLEGGIGFVDLGDLSQRKLKEGYKIINIDDKRPTDKGYPFPAQ